MYSLREEMLYLLYAHAYASDANIIKLNILCEDVSYMFKGT